MNAIFWYLQNMKKLIFILTLIIVIQGHTQESIPPERLALDDSLKMAVFQIKEELFKANTTFVWKNKELLLSKQDSTYTLTHTSTQATYIAYNTPLPLIQIDAPNGIINEPKRMSTIQYADSTETLTSFAGIELRGSSSLFFPKKTYDLNFYQDNLGQNNKDVRFGDLRKDDDWILDGLYNEPLRMRSYLSLSLWREIYAPAYLDKEPNAKSGVGTAFCELVVNGHYKGIYLLTEQVDRKLLKLVKEDSTGVRGELFQGSAYQGAVTFDSIPAKKNYLRRWGGYDIEYPYPNNIPWDNLYPFTETIVNGDETAFAKAIQQQLNLDNIIDYFLFVNAVRAPDNLGKNIYLARYDRGAPYFYVPWDLDGTFGTIYSGQELNITNDFLDNGLLRRLLEENPEDFISRFKSRWIALRADVLATDKLVQWQTAHYEQLLKSGAYKREASAWNTTDFSTTRLDYMTTWTSKRMEFLDSHIAQLVPKTD